MKAKTISLYVFFIAAFLATLGNALESNTLLLLGKPIVIPSLVFYYFVESKKQNILIYIICGLNFIGESFALLNFGSEITYMIIPFFFANLGIL